MDSEFGKTPMVSIVLPVYNGEEFLGEAIESILNQTYVDWELIIVNDCSTDSSRSIMQEYADKDARIHVVDNPANLKLPRSLNSGFGVARGEYYTWTSDDNLLKSTMLETLVKELDNNPGYGMVYSNHDDIDEKGCVIRHQKLGEPRDMYVIGNVCGASFLYRKTVADMVGDYDPDMFLAEDYDYWMRVFSVTNIKHITDELYSCRRHKASLTETKKKQISVQTFRALSKNFWSMLKKTETLEDRVLLNKLLYDFAVQAGEQHRLEQLVREADKLLKKKIRKDRVHAIKKILKRLLRKG